MSASAADNGVAFKAARLGEALRYAELGWPPFPLRGKVPSIAGGRGHLDATTDAEAIGQLWAQAGAVDGIGVNLEAAGLALLDIDPRNGGDLDSLRAEFGMLPDAPDQATSGGGVHVVFASTACAVTSRAGWRPGIDLKTNGYMVVAPSRHPSGGSYEWTIAPHDLAPPPAPRWLEAALRERRNGAAGASEQSTAIPKGKRNATLTSLAGVMRRPGMSAEALLAVLVKRLHIRNP